MSIVRKTIALTDQQSEWVKTRVNSGDYTNDSEYIRDLIRRDQAHNAELEQLRAALVAGEQSGISPLTFDDIRRSVRDRLQGHGKP